MYIYILYKDEISKNKIIKKKIYSRKMDIMINIKINISLVNYNC